MTHPIEKIARFMRLGGQKVPETYKSYENVWPDLNSIKWMIQEEMDELKFALHHDNSPETLDAFIDIAYVALTGAIRMVGEEKATQAWDEVVKANLAKVDGTYGEPYIYAGKIQKPEGWVAPDMQAILDAV